MTGGRLLALAGLSFSLSLGLAALPGCVGSAVAAGSSSSSNGFVHPAGWHTAADIRRVRRLIASGREPWASTAELLMNDSSLTAGYSPDAAPLVCRTCCNVACCAPGSSCHGASSVRAAADAADAADADAAQQPPPAPPAHADRVATRGSASLIAEARRWSAGPGTFTPRARSGAREPCLAVPRPMAR